MDTNEMKHDGPMPPPPHDHHHMHGMWKSWSSWESPVGLGIFFLTTALAAAIALYALLNLVSAIVSIVHPAPSYSYPTEMPTSDGAAAGSATDATGGAVMSQ